MEFGRGRGDVGIGALQCGDKEVVEGTFKAGQVLCREAGGWGKEGEGGDGVAGLGGRGEVVGGNECVELRNMQMLLR